MSWKFERIFDSDGTELSTPSMATSLEGAFEMCYDGRYVWVTTGTGVAIYEFWGAASDNEPAFNTLDELNYNRYDSGLKKKLRLVTFIKIGSSTMQRVTREPSLAEPDASKHSLSTGETAYYKSSSSPGALSPKYIAFAAGKVYVTNGTSFTQIYEFDPQTHSFTRVIGVQETMNSNLCSADAKLWFVGSSFGDNAPQKLYGLNPLTNVKTTTVIPVRPSLARSWLCHGNNGSVYMTNYNNVSVTRFNTVDATFGATIRLNAFPSRIFSGPDRRIWVSSYAGMLSLVDWDDDGVHNDWGLESEVLSAAVDPTDASKFWAVRSDGVLVRLNLNDKKLLQTYQEPKRTIEATNTSSKSATSASSGASVNTTSDLGVATKDNITYVHDPVTDTTYEYVPVIWDTDKDIYKWEYRGEVDPEQQHLRDWNISHPTLDKPDFMMFTPGQVFTDMDGVEHTLKPYLFMIQSGKILALRMENYLYRDVFLETYGQAAVVGGSQQYFGEQ